MNDVAEIRERLERLEKRIGAQTADPAARPLRFPWEARLPGCLRYGDPVAHRAVAEESLRAMGLELQPPDETAEELRARMEQGGVKPDERLGNVILEEMRGYRVP